MSYIVLLHFKTQDGKQKFSTTYLEYPIEEIAVIQVKSAVRVTQSRTVFRPYFSNVGIIGERGRFL